MQAIIFSFTHKSDDFQEENVTEKVFEFRDELKLFFEVQPKVEFFAWLDDGWIMCLAYLINFLEQLNKLNLQMQGRNANIIKIPWFLECFHEQAEHLKEKVQDKKML